MVKKRGRRRSRVDENEMKNRNLMDKGRIGETG